MRLARWLLLLLCAPALAQIGGNGPPGGYIFPYEAPTPPTDGQVPVYNSSLGYYQPGSGGGGGITALTGQVAASGTGSVAATVQNITEANGSFGWLPVVAAVATSYVATSGIPAAIDGVTVAANSSVLLTGEGQFTATISGTSMTVSAVTSGFSPTVGDPISGTGVTAGTYLTAVGAGGTTGPYTVSVSQTVGSATTMIDANSPLNGLWIVETSAWTIAPYYQSISGTLSDQFVTTCARLGTSYGGSCWSMITPGRITIGTTPTDWVQIPLNVNVVQGILPIANGGTGTATPSLVAGSNVTITGSWPNQTINSTGGSSSGGGSVSSVGLSSSAGTITVSGTNPVTGTGTINVDIPTTYLASPPAIGGTAPAAVAATALTGTSANISGLTTTQFVRVTAASVSTTINGMNLPASNTPGIVANSVQQIEWTAGHEIALGTAPALTSCGSGSPTTNTQANDHKGTITEGTTATGCIATFHTAYATAPDCVVTSPSGAVLTSYSTSTTALTLVNASATGDTFTYVCIQ